ncbi:MAG: hypothetical protein GC201_16380 [Alphaproteobacteria bacterium]|nr:hypothetical protein [Alphaproteobacteria bacterium]
MSARRGLLFPKPRGRRRTHFVPTLPVDSLNWILGEAAPDERKALAQIVETSDLIRLQDGTELLVIPTTPALLDRLAAFQAEGEDREWDHEDMKEEDDDSDSDNAWDYAHDGWSNVPGDGDLELDYSKPPAGARKSYEAFVDHRREEMDVNEWNGQTRRTPRPEGRHEVVRMRRAVGTPSRRGRWS